MNRILFLLIPMLLCSAASAIERVRVDDAGKGFVLVDSHRPFHPWGFNYGGTSKLIEEYWIDDWPKIVRDFANMKSLGANVIRIHLQVGSFLDGPDKANETSLDRLVKLTELAEADGLYLDLTGLACYRAAATPKWYDELSEKDRWAAQARFWSAIAGRCRKSPAVFCYDLMNEPLIPSGKRPAGQWLSGKPLGGFDFVQLVSIDQAGRPREQIAVDWIRTLSRAIREQDKDHLITVGQMPSTPAWGHFSGFIPEKVAPELDYISVHIYPEQGKLDEAIKTLKGFAVGKPLVIEETFPLTCSAEELKDFLLQSRPIATGWIGHYGDESLPELIALDEEKKLTMPQALMMSWLKLFRDAKGEMKIE